MRIPLKELLEKLGIDREMAAYETQPWLHYDADQELTCSAEVRIGPSARDLEAEIQFMKDEDATEDEGGEEDGGIAAGERKQIMLMRALPDLHGEWEIKFMRIKEKDYVNEFHDWEQKGCNFFRLCVQAMNRGETPDIEALVEKEMNDDSWGGGGSRGRVGRKSPKIKPASLLGMKKGM